MHATLPIPQTASCPFKGHAAHAPQPAAQRTPAAASVAGLLPQDGLQMPLHRSVVAQYAQGEAGAELRLYCGDQEISFDEPAYFAFGETLAQQSRFTAGAAMHWGPGYHWTQVQPLLQQLLDAGVLRRADLDVAVDDVHPLTGARPAPLPPGPCEQPREWADCEVLMQQLTGQPLELGWLELAVPVFRVAHIALDAEGRQVGEANVFPKALRLDVPTNWRACIYPGTRYQPERPMNVTALKAMRQHWNLMMLGLARVRSAYLARYPQASGGWTVGQLERLATCVLALPTYLLMRSEQPVANGDLHPALSSMFRVTDGLRMTLHQMLFVPIGEPTLPADAPIDAAAIFDYAERNYSFHSEHGVCAGPRSMIEQFLAVLVDGAEPPPVPGDMLDADFQAALQAIEPALNYALLGLRAHAAAFTLWPLMAASYEKLQASAQAWAAHGGTAVRRFASHLDTHVHTLRASTYLGSDALRRERLAVYAEMYAQCGLGLQGRGMAIDTEPLVEAIRPQLSCSHARVDRQIEHLLQQRLGRRDGADRADARRLRDDLMEFLLQMQAVLRVACAAQFQVNTCLGRAQPQRAFGSAELDLHNLLQGMAERRLPYWIDELGLRLGVHIAVDADAIRITETLGSKTHKTDKTEQGVPASAAHHPDSTGMVPAELRAPRTSTTRSHP